ncbi:MAG: S41 family peptidase, partial [Myxococcota bacterium]
PELFKEIKTSTKGKFGGLGIQIQARDGFITVVAPIKDHPAWRAGIKRLDKIVRIDDESTASMTIDEAVNLLRGAPGTRVTIWVIRDGQPEPKKYQLLREIIKIGFPEAHMLDGGVGYIKVTQFTEQTPTDLLDAYNKLKEQNGAELKGLVIDMRDNPGGLLESSIKVSNFFLKSGGIVSTVAQESTKVEDRRAEADAFRIGVPVAVLMNGGSASASEIVAGALKDNNRAIILGQKSFGKGSVQVLYERQLPADDFSKDRREAGLKMTVAQYLTPADISIQSVGITPDILLEPIYFRKDKTQLFYDDRPHKEKDLQKHLDDNKAARDEKPALSMRYIADEKDQDLTDDEEENEAQKKAREKEEDADKFVPDFPMRLASRIIQSTTQPTRTAMIKAAQAIADGPRLKKTSSSSCSRRCLSTGLPAPSLLRRQ